MFFGSRLIVDEKGTFIGLVLEETKGCFDDGVLGLGVVGEGQIGIVQDALMIEGIALVVFNE
jgi:hypothetical protein